MDVGSLHTLSSLSSLREIQKKDSGTLVLEVLLEIIKGGIMKNRRILLIGLLVVFITGFSLFGQQGPTQKAAMQKKPPGAEKTPPKVQPPSITKHTITIGGKSVSYTATVGEMIVNKPDEKPGASMFYIAYTRNDVRDTAKRPITFAFNGGPGSSSVWLHLGGLGPRRVAMDDEGNSTSPPFGMTDNENSLIDVTDLVFIDPVSTGYSRPLPGENKSQFHGVQEDVASVGEFIRLYITKNERWDSPKFVLGESYGTTRAAGLSGFLQGRTHGMYLNGIVLVSSVLDFSTIVFMSGNLMPYMLFLPHYTATAWYHKKLPPELQSLTLEEVVEKAEKFALDEYSVALIKGNNLPEDGYEEIAGKVAAYTGLSLDYVKQSNLRIRHDRFVKELLRSDFHTVGRLDSRFKGRDSDAAGENYEYDPSSSVIQGSFSTMLNYYLREELDYAKDIPYAIFGNVYPWNFSQIPSGPGQQRGSGLGMGLNVAEILRQAMAENEYLQVFCCNGYYDGATPFFGTEHTFAQMGLNSEFKDRVKMGYYEAGHMMYIHKPSIIKLKRDLAEFIKGASGEK
jgi:carboxypeptidase C (cathepsin A)